MSRCNRFFVFVLVVAALSSGILVTRHVQPPSHRSPPRPVRLPPLCVGVAYPGCATGIVRVGAPSAVLPAAIEAGLLPHGCSSAVVGDAIRPGDLLELAPEPDASCLVRGRHRLPGAQRLICGVGLNVNTDPAEDLELLPSIGPVRAGAIVGDRRERGPFRQIADLRRVRGIGEATAELLEPWLLFDPAEALPR